MKVIWVNVLFFVLCHGAGWVWLDFQTLKWFLLSFKIVPVFLRILLANMLDEAQLFFSSFFPCCNCSILWQECYFIVSLIQVVKIITDNSNKIKRCQVFNEGSNLNWLIPHGNIHVIEGILYLWILQWINILFRSKHSRKLYATLFIWKDNKSANTW